MTDDPPYGAYLPPDDSAEVHVRDVRVIPAQPHTPVRSVRVPEAIWAAAKARAKREGVTVTSVIVDALREYGRGRRDAPGGAGT